MSRIMYSHLLDHRNEPLPRRTEYTEMDNLEKAFLRGDIDEKTYDQEMNSLIKLYNRRSR